MIVFVRRKNIDIGDDMTNWALYDDTSGNTWIQTRDDVLKCPICNSFIDFHGKYEGVCCGIKFKQSWGLVRITTPFRKHDKKYGRGWQSIRKISIEDVRKWWNEIAKHLPHD